jgi:transposase
LKKVVQKSRCPNHRRRALARLLRYEQYTISEISRQLRASRTSVKRWDNLYLRFGESGLVPEQGGRPAVTVNESVCAKLLELVRETRRYGYVRSRWTSEMLAKQIREQLKRFIHASTVRRLLPKLGVKWRRARPTLLIQDPQ